MFCSKCGKENAANAKFCVSCGAKMVVPAAPVAPETPVAPVTPAAPAEPVKEQQPVPVQPTQPAAAPVPPMQQPVAAVPEKKKKKGNTAAKVVIILLVLALLVAAGFLAFHFVTKGMQEKKVAAELDTAEQYLKDSEFENAVASYLKALELDAENEEAVSGLTDAYIRWSESYIQANDFDAAISLLENVDAQASKKKIEAALNDAMVAKTAYEEEVALQKEKEAEEEAARLAEEARARAGETLLNYLNEELIPYYGLVDTTVGYEVPYVRTKAWEVTDYYTRDNEAAPLERVIDNADVLETSEEDNLTQMIAEVEAEIGCDIVVVTINESVLAKYGETDTSEETREACMAQYANDYYQDNLYGFNEAGGDGVLLLDNRYEGESGIYFAPYGRVADTYTAEKISEILTRINKSVNSSTYRAYGTFVKHVWLEMLSLSGVTFVNGGNLEGAAGILNYDIRDYDGDGQDEMLTLVNLDTVDEYGDFCNIVVMQMYEVDGDEVTLAHEAGALQPAFGGCDYEKDNFYINEEDGIAYIAVDCQKSSGLFVEGSYYGIGLWRYDGSQFINLVLDDLSGSDFYESEIFANVASLLYTYGFTASATAIDDGTYSCLSFDPAGDGLQLLLGAEGTNPYLQSYEDYMATEDYTLWAEESDPAGLGKVTYYFSHY